MISRRELLKWMSQSVVLLPVLNIGCQSSGGSSGTNSVKTAPPDTAYQGTDDQLLDDMERAAFTFFWEQAPAATGQVKDRATATGNDKHINSSIAATGFGLTALCIADHRKYGDAAEIKKRVLTTLQFVKEHVEGHNGWFYHFVDMNTGARVWKCELSSIDTCLLLCGVLTARQYYAADPQIAELATAIYHDVDFNWMLNGGKALSMGWHPESGFLPQRWDHYCELMMIYLLGIGSPKHPIPVDTWNAFSRPQVQFQQYSYISGDPNLFTHQYSHAWFDFRKKKDAYADYFQNSATATKAHKAFCVSLHSEFPDYTDDLWGVSASDYAKGYTAWGGPPRQGPLDGTIVPYAAAGSLPFVPQDCLAVLRKIRTTFGAKAWGRYGFVDAFNPLTGYYDAEILGIDQGIAMLMVENFRSGFVWETFMKNPEVQFAMKAVGFRSV
jgi:hypothetical protein